MEEKCSDLQSQLTDARSMIEELEAVREALKDEVRLFLSKNHLLFLDRRIEKREDGRKRRTERVVCLCRKRAFERRKRR